MDPGSLPTLAGVPAPGPRNVAVHCDRSAQRALRKGHPWLYSDGVRSQSHEGATGDLAVVFDERRRFLAVGLYDPGSPIRVRVLQVGKQRPIDAEFFRERQEACFRRRAPLRADGTDGHRLIHGENEGLPGVVVDRYAGTLVLKLDTPAWVPWLPLFVPALLQVQAAERVVLRFSRDGIRRAPERHGLEEGCILLGEPLTDPVLFRENGLTFECDPVLGQKTGFFLDQRDNRRRVGELSRAHRVLNVFAYTGGFSVSAARGGARSVTSLDLSAPALEVAERNLAYLPGKAVPHEVIVGDAFTQLQELAAAGRRFDLVVVDPPSFAKRRADHERALASYRRLQRCALGVLERGGMLVSASCSAKVTRDEFFAAVRREATRVGRPLEVLETSEHALDHPIGFPEGAYLKCLFARAP